MDMIALPQSLLTIQDLQTIGGLIVAVYVIVSLLKEPLKKLVKHFSKTTEGDWVVRPFSVIIAFLIMMWLVYIEGKYSPETIGLSVINAFIVALISGATHDYIVAPTKSKLQVVRDKENRDSGVSGDSKDGKDGKDSKGSNDKW